MKPGKALFSSVGKTDFIILFCLLFSFMLLRVGIAEKTAISSNIIYQQSISSDIIKWLILNCDLQDNLFAGRAASLVLDDSLQQCTQWHRINLTLKQILSINNIKRGFSLANAPVCKLNISTEGADHLNLLPNTLCTRCSQLYKLVLGLLQKPHLKSVLMLSPSVMSHKMLFHLC